MMIFSHFIITLQILLYSIFHIGIAQQPTDIFFQTIVRFTNSNWLLSKSISAYYQSLGLGLNNSAVHMNLGIIYYEQGFIDLAIGTFHHAIELEPTYPDVYCSLAIALYDKGQIIEAEKYLNTALKLCPSHAEALYNLANIKLEQDYIQEANRLYLKALEVFPEFAEAHSNFASCLRKQGKLLEALYHHNEATRIQPMFANAYSNMGNTFKATRDWNSAKKCYLHAITIDPKLVDAHTALGSIYKDSGKFKEAIDAYKTALRLNPDFPYAFCDLLHCMIVVCDWSNYEWRIQRLSSIVTEELEKNRMPSIHPFNALLFPLSQNLRMAICRRNTVIYFEKIKLLNKPPYKYISELSTDNRLRIGYVSSNFAHHPMTHLMQSIPGLHNKSKVEIFCYALSQDDQSKFRSKIVKESDHFVDLSQVSCNGEAADIINSDGIHILVNMNGYTGGERNEIFAMRPAPIQVMWIGFPGTSGASFIDYIITDRVTSPVELAFQYSEKLAYMPHTYLIGDHKQMFPQLCERIIVTNNTNCEKDVVDNLVVLNGIDLSPISENTTIKEIKRFVNSTIGNLNHTKCVEVILKVAELKNLTYIENMITSGEIQTSINGVIVQNGQLVSQTQHNVGTGEEVLQNIVVTSRQQYGLPGDAVVYCCFNQLSKIDPHTFDMWVNILKAVPNSVLWLVRFPQAGETNINITATNLGIGSGRIIFVDTVNKEEHVRRGQLADICLDTLIYNGHTTSMDILWSGTPIVTLPSESFASRVAASLLTTLGCPELIAGTRQEYQDIAIRLGTDKEYLKTTRAKVWRARLESPLFNCSMYAYDLERLYMAMWDKFQRRESPDHIFSVENY